VFTRQSDQLNGPDSEYQEFDHHQSNEFINDRTFEQGAKAPTYFSNSNEKT
jgi:hypothetical protein